MQLDIFNNKKVLVTGHTGFKGAWLSIWLELLGARVTGLGLGPLHEEGVFSASGIGQRMTDHRCDIRDLDAVLAVFEAEQPDIVFHLAAQALVLDGYRDPAGTFATNTQGTANILEAIRLTPSVRAAVLVTTDKCYENQEWVYGYRETDPMGGHDPYSASKGAAELVISSYRRSYFSKPGTAAIASGRAGNVIGGGDWSGFRLVPDIIRAVQAGQTLEIRSPAAIRPWQHVVEPLGGYLMLAQKLWLEPDRYAEAWNFGPLPNNQHRVGAVVNAFFEYFRQHAPAHLPGSRTAGWRDVSDPAQPHEAGLLMLDISKAIHRLGWCPVLDFRETVQLTADWYIRFSQENVLDLCRQHIKHYETLWNSRNEN